MTDIDAKIKDLKARTEEARRIKTKADLQRDNARATVDRVASKLKEEFGINSLAAADELLKEMDNELEERMNRIKEELRAFE